jgi:hypothetical protein
MDYSLASALLAGVKRDRILNFMSADKLRDWSAAVRQG